MCAPSRALMGKSEGARGPFVPRSMLTKSHASREFVSKYSSNAFGLFGRLLFGHVGRL